MKLLLDTHIALWSLTDDARLSEAARALILDPENDIHVSAATLWEIAIKHGLNRSGPNAMPIGAADARHLFEASGYGLIPITPEQVLMVQQLPKLHADPFDRILIAQALADALRLVTHDALMASYNTQVILV